MGWLADNVPTVVALATSAGAALVAAVRILWTQLVSLPRLECAAEKVILRTEAAQARAETKAEQQDHLRTLRSLVALQTKFDRLRGSGSPPPPSAT